MLLCAMLLATIRCQTGSNNSPQLASNDIEDVVESGPKCKFGLVKPNLECYRYEITKAPRIKTPPPAVQSFPGRVELTVVSSTSSMIGDLKCSGTNDDQIIQLAIDNMNVTVDSVLILGRRGNP
jgi:hypothetical protein